MRFTAETCGCFTPAYMKGWTYVRTDNFLRTKISWTHRQPNVLTHSVTLREEGKDEYLNQIGSEN